MHDKSYYLGYLALGIIVALFISYLIQFGGQAFSSNTNDWANFGTYIGGVSSVLLTFITIWLLILSLNLQSKYSATSQFVSSFFELIQLHKEITANLKGEVGPVKSGFVRDPDGGEYKGLEYIEMISIVIDHKVDGKYDNDHGTIVKKEVSEKLGSKREQQNQIDKFYDQLYKGKETVLGHYFRSLYHIVKFVDESPVEDKQKYVDLIQAYLTDSELHILFYNAIGRHGRESFRPLLDKYNFFENIDSRGLFFEKHFETFFPLTYPSFKKKQKYKNLSA